MRQTQVDRRDPTDNTDPADNTDEAAPAAAEPPPQPAPAPDAGNISADASQGDEEKSDTTELETVPLTAAPTPDTMPASPIADGTANDAFPHAVSPVIDVFPMITPEYGIVVSKHVVGPRQLDEVKAPAGTNPPAREAMSPVAPPAPTGKTAQTVNADEIASAPPLGSVDAADDAPVVAGAGEKPEHAPLVPHPAPADATDAPEAIIKKSLQPTARPHDRDEMPAPQDAAKPATDGSQTASLPQPADRLGQLTHLTPAAPVAHTGTATTAETSAAVPMAGLAIEIAARAQSGHNRFEIRLDPPELGRIDVHLDVDHSGHVTSRLVVEKSETLDLLRRDASELERALQQAGLKTSDSGLQFTLRDQSFAGRDDNRPAPDMARIVVPDTELGSVDIARNGGYGRSPRLDGGIDIRV